MNVKTEADLEEVIWGPKLFLSILTGILALTNDSFINCKCMALSYSLISYQSSEYNVLNTEGLVTYYGEGGGGVNNGMGEKVKFYPYKKGAR